MYSFPELLKRIRAASGLTQGQLADVLGVSTILVSMVETEQKEVSKKFIRLLAEKMDVSPTSITPFLFFEKDGGMEKISNLEKSLIEFGEKLQKYLIDTKAKNLRKYV